MQANGGARPLGPSGARMLYNLADALHPDVVCDPTPAAERALRHAGPGAVRRIRTLLLWLEWEPVLTGRARRRFWRLPLEERRAACARMRESRFAGMRRGWAHLSAWVEDALEATLHSSEGA